MYPIIAPASVTIHKAASVVLVTQDFFSLSHYVLNLILFVTYIFETTTTKKQQLFITHY